MKYIKNNRLFINPLIWKGRKIFNPSTEQLAEAGWIPVEEPQPTEQELREQEIESLKQQLATTDYIAIKYVEGWLTDEEFADTRAQRQAWRDRINELENEGE